MHVEPNKRNVKKCDPVAQFQKYNQAWSSQRAPGEKSHSQLRWGVREQMLYQDEVVDRVSWQHTHGGENTLLSVLIVKS